MKKSLQFVFMLVACVAMVSCGDDDDTKTNPEQENSSQTPSATYAVDLGLSVKWADRNVGAASPEDYGLCFAWGETTGYPNDGSHSFLWETYTHGTNYDALTKYN